MTDLMEKTLIQTIADMLYETQDVQWIRSELSEMFEVDLHDNKIWFPLYVRGVLKMTFSPENRVPACILEQANMKSTKH